VAGLFVLMALAYYVGPANWLDSSALSGFSALERPRVDWVANQLAGLCDPLPYALVAAGVIAIAFVARGLRTAAAVGFLLLGANASSQLLKPLLAHHRELYYTQWHMNNLNDASFPSGHATAAMTLSLAVLMIVPRSYRPVTAVVGTLYTLGVSFSILILSWHYPSDVVGGFLMATAWGLVSIAALRYANARWPHEGEVRAAAREAIGPPPRGAVGLAFLVGCGVLCVAAATRADQIAGFANRHTAFVAVAGAIAVAAALLLAAVVALSAQRSEHAAPRQQPSR
jgi:membrane-associated phospholipid phosphatase